LAQVLTFFDLALSIANMLRAAVRAPARGALRCSAPRRSCQVSKPKRCGKGDGISHEVEYEGVWGAITTFPKRQPYATNIIVATVKTSLADIAVQKAQNPDKDIDWKRNGVFTMFGFAYLGIAQWFVYVTVFTRLCPNAIRFSNLSWADKLKDRAGQIDLVKQTLLDNFVHYTFIYFPVFYTFKELIQADQAGSENQDGLFSRAMQKYWKNSVQDNLAIWALWIPLDLAIYAAPVWMRLPLNHSVSLLWTMILSSMRGDEK